MSHLIGGQPIPRALALRWSAGPWPSPVKDGTPGVDEPMTALPARVGLLRLAQPPSFSDRPAMTSGAGRSPSRAATRSTSAVLALCLAAVPAMGQSTADTGTVVADSTALEEALAAEPGPSLPLFATLGVGWGSRQDGCSLCASPLDDASFTGHLSLGRPLGRGFAIGTDASVWMRGRPGTPQTGDSTGVSTPTTLSTMLGNASVTVSYQASYVWAKAGAGFAWGHQDLETAPVGEEPAILRATGKGIGYTLGGGIKVPVHSLVALAFFGNWNVGTYDMSTENGVVARGSRHAYYELGFGVTLR